MPLIEALDVVHTSTCDDVFKRGIRINEFRTWILRTHPKGNRPAPEYLYSVESPYNGQRLQSQGHALLLQARGAKVRLTHPDGYTTVEMQDYKTASKTDLKDVKKMKDKEEEKRIREAIRDKFLAQNFNSQQD